MPGVSPARCRVGRPDSVWPMAPSRNRRFSNRSCAGRRRAIRRGKLYFELVREKRQRSAISEVRRTSCSCAEIGPAISGRSSLKVNSRPHPRLVGQDPRDLPRGLEVAPPSFRTSGRTPRSQGSKREGEENLRRTRDDVVINALGNRFAVGTNSSRRVGTAHHLNTSFVTRRSEW